MNIERRSRDDQYALVHKKVNCGTQRLLSRNIKRVNYIETIYT